MNAEDVRALAARLARATEVDDETRLMRIDGDAPVRPRWISPWS